MANASSAASSAPSGPSTLRAMVTARGKQTRNHSSYSASASSVIASIMPTKGPQGSKRLTTIEISGEVRPPTGSEEAGSHLLLEETGVGDSLPRDPLPGVAKAMQDLVVDIE